MEEKTEKKQPKISTANAVLMVCVAIIFDLIALVPIIGGIIALVGGLVVFGIWFLHLKLPLINPKKVVSSIVNLGVNVGGEIVTVGVWAGFTVGIILIIVSDRVEAKTGVSVLSVAGKGSTKPVIKVKYGDTDVALPKMSRLKKPAPEMNDVRVPNSNDAQSQESAA